MAVTPIHSTITVTTAGTEIQCVTDTDIKPVSVYFEAAKANGGVIYVGLSTVSSTIYIASLSPGIGFSLGAEMGAGIRGGSQGIQLSNLWVDSSVNGEKVQMTYLYATGG